MTIYQVKTVFVDWVELPETLRKRIRDEQDWRFGNDICIELDNNLPTYEQLCNYEQSLVEKAKEWECQPKDVEGDSDWAICKELFDLNPKAFIGYGALIIDICW